MAQRLVRHHGTEVRAADADVDDIADSFARIPLPRPVAHAVGKLGHLIQYGMHLRNDVLAIQDDRLPARRP